MPRLLLVDDNPSIHKIAETLLATSDIQLVSCESGAQALAMVDQGEQFDVALLDTSMLGMDGWTLLRHLRGHQSTARMPVAMMAGVLDQVDPEQVRQAPIQGFLKKPVELRDLGERVHHLMETEVPEPAPEPEPVPEPEPEPPAAQEEAAAGEDILDLEPEDVLPEAVAEPEAGAPEAEADADTGLDLEDLDLEGLANLSFPAPEPEPAAAPAGTAMPDFVLADTLPDSLVQPPAGAASGSASVFVEPLPDLDLEAAAPTATAHLDWTDDSDSLVGLADAMPAAPAPQPEPAAPPVDLAPDILARPTAPAPVPAPDAPAPAPGTPDPLAALLADPALMDRLAQAVVARLGDRALREIAWEVMPELAERIRQQVTP